MFSTIWRVQNRPRMDFFSASKLDFVHCFPFEKRQGHANWGLRAFPHLALTMRHYKRVALTSRYFTSPSNVNCAVCPSNGPLTQRCIASARRSPSALARNDPTLLARSDPAPLESGCSICRPPGKDHAQFELRAGAVQVIVVDRTFRHSLVPATDQGAADTAGVRLLPR